MGVTYIPAPPDPLGENLSRGLSQGMMAGFQRRMGQQDLNSILNYMRQQALYPQTQLPLGVAGPQMPAPSMPVLNTPQGQQMMMSGMLGQMFRDPLDREYKQAQIESAKALTSRRKEEEKQALPDRMLRQADRYLRVIDDIMSEYWYTPEGPYRDKLLKDVQANREKALRLIEKYAPNSEAAKQVEGRLKKLDNDIATGKPGIDEQIQSQPTGNITGSAGDMVKPKGKTFVVDSYPPPQSKEEFDRTLKSITSEAEKDRWFELHFKKEWSPK